MKLEELWRARRSEMQMESLQKLDEGFYEEVHKYLRELEREVEMAREDEKGVVQKEFENAKTVVEDIIDERIRKIVKLAMLKSKGVKVKEENMNPDERRAFEKICDALKELYGRFSDHGDVAVLRILESIPQFLGADGKTYEVVAEDVLTLPRMNADALCRRGAAAEVRIGNGEAA